MFGAKSSPSCANFCLRQTALEFAHLYDPTILEIVRNNFYVDDCLLSVSSVEEAISAQRSLCELLRRRGFHLRKWLSNNEQVIKAIPDSERARLVNNYSFDVSSHERVLGVNWDIKEDQFTFFINLPHNPFTKRGLLSTIASLYDPLGFVSPVVLEAKVFLQGLTRRKAGWDEEITSSESERWSNWLSLLSRLNEVSVPRCFKTQELAKLKNAEIHNFSDASSFAYGVCSYLRLIDENGNVACSFLIGKSRVSPIKAISIPRLELTAAVLAVRLNEKMQRELNLESYTSIFWCRWIKEFLFNLSRRRKWSQKNRKLQLIDIVLIVEDMQQRSKWVLGRVVKTFPDKSGVVRTVSVKTLSSVITRPITKL